MSKLGKAFAAVVFAVILSNVARHYKPEWGKWCGLFEMAISAIVIVIAYRELMAIFTPPVETVRTPPRLNEAEQEARRIERNVRARIRRSERIAAARAEELMGGMTREAERVTRQVKKTRKKQPEEPKVENTDAPSKWDRLLGDEDDLNDK
jgi:hypothetical protein